MEETINLRGTLALCSFGRPYALGSKELLDLNRSISPFVM